MATEWQKKYIYIGKRVSEKKRRKRKEKKRKQKKRKEKKRKEKKRKEKKRKRKTNLCEKDLVNENSKGPPVNSSSIVLLTKNLRGHKLRSSTERVGGLPKSHVLLAQTIVSDLDVTVNIHQNVIQFQITAQYPDEKGEERGEK